MFKKRYTPPNFLKLRICAHNVGSEFSVDLEGVFLPQANKLFLSEKACITENRDYNFNTHGGLYKENLLFV